MLQCLPRIQYRVVANYYRQIALGWSTNHNVHSNAASTLTVLEILGADEPRMGQKCANSTTAKLQFSNELVTRVNRTSDDRSSHPQPQQMNINVMVDDLLHHWELDHTCTQSKPTRSVLFRLLSFSSHGWTTVQKARLLRLIMSRANVPNPLENDRRRSKLLSIADIHWNLRNAALGLKDRHSTEPFDRWCTEEIDRNFRPAHSPITMWNALRLISLPYAIRDCGRDYEEDSSSPYAMPPLADMISHTLLERPTLLTIISILLCQIRLRDIKGRSGWKELPSTLLRSLWEAYLNLAADDASILVQAHHAILVAFVNLCGLSRNMKLLEQVLSFGGNRGFLNLIGPSGYPPAAVDVGDASILCGLDSWESIFSNFRSSGFGAILDSDRGEMKEVASKIVIRWVRQDNIESVVVAHELYMDTANTTFRLTSTAIEFICQALIKANLLDRAIVCCSDEALSPSHKGRMVEGILLHLTSDDHSCSSGLTTEMCMSLLSIGADGEANLVRNDNKLRWERLLLSMQAQSRNLRCYDFVLAAPATIWSANFLLEFLRILMKQKLYKKAHKTGKHISSGHPSSCKLLKELSELLALAFQPQLASATWSLISSHEQSRASTTLRLLASVDFCYRHPKVPEVLKVPKLLLSSRRNGARIHEKELNIALYLLTRAGCITSAQSLLRRLRVQGLFVQLPVTSVNIFISSFINSQSPPCNARQLQRIFQYSQALFSRENIRPDPATFFVLLRVVIRWKLVTATDLMDIFNTCIRTGYPIKWPNSLPDQLPFEIRESNALLIDLATPTSLKRHIRPIYRLFVRAFKARNHKAAAAVVEAILKSLPLQ